MTALDLFPTVDEQAERNIAGVRDFAKTHGLLFEGTKYAWAVFSPCRTYRYLLGRQWTPDGACMRWVMLNPSTAGATGDDPTSRKVRGFSDRRAGSYVIANLGALVSTAGMVSFEPGHAERRAARPPPTEKAKRDAASKRRNKAKKGGRS